MATAKAKTVETAEQIETVVAAGNQTIETVVKAVAEAASQGYEKAVALTKGQVDAAVKAGATAFKGYEDVAEFNKLALEAFVTSSTVFARGLQEMSKNMASVAQSSIEENIAAGKAIMGAKSLKEAIDLQSGLAKSNFEKLVAESTKFSEISAKLAEEAFAPLNSRLSDAVKKLVKPAV